NGPWWRLASTGPGGPEAGSVQAWSSRSYQSSSSAGAAGAWPPPSDGPVWPNGAFAPPSEGWSWPVGASSTVPSSEAAFSWSERLVPDPAGPQAVTYGAAVSAPRISTS